MKSNRRSMAIVGWTMTLAGSATVIFWVLYEAAMDFNQSPIATIASVVIVLALMALLVPLPLWLATRRASARRGVLHP